MKTQEQLIEESLELVKSCVNDLNKALDGYHQSLNDRVKFLKLLGAYYDCDPNTMQAIVDLEAELSDLKKREGESDGPED